MDGATGPTSATAATGSALEAVLDPKTLIALYVWDFSFFFFLAVTVHVFSAWTHETHSFAPLNVLYVRSQIITVNSNIWCFSLNIGITYLPNITHWQMRFVNTDWETLTRWFLWLLSFASIELSVRGDGEFSGVFIITLKYGFYYCPMHFLFGSQYYDLASLWKMFPITARLDLNTAFLLTILGRRAVPKMFYLNYILLHVLT